jgi:periplasmic protein TonB
MFEQSLIESAHLKAGSKKAMSLPVSILVHGLVIGLALGASIWFVGDVPEPSIPVTFYAAAPPPPPPPPAAPKPAAPKPEAPKPVQPVKPVEMAQPVVIPETVPQPLAEPEPAAADTGVEGGVEGGVPGGVPGGVMGGVPGGTGAGTGAEPLRVGGDVKAPVLQSRIEPIITDGGAVEDVRVLKSVNPLLDASAVRAVQQWKYKPATLNGRAVRVYLTVTVTFRLN